MRSTIRYVGLDFHKEKIVIDETYYPLPSQ